MNGDPVANGKDVRQLITSAVETALAEAEEFSTKWVFAAEAIGADSDRGLWFVVSQDAKPWDTMGMMEYALAVERAAIIVRRAKDDDG